MIEINIAGDFAVSREILGVHKEFILGKGLNEVFYRADLNVLNLEAPVIHKPTPSVKYGPHLSTNTEIETILKKIKINLVTLANNHILDHGAEGLLSTMRFLQDNNIAFIGAGNSLEQASKEFVFEKEGVKVGFLNFAENEFSNTYGSSPGAAPLDLIANTLQIQELKKSVDKVIVIVHGGAELHTYPSPRFKKLLEYFVLQGADAVIGHHTHRYNGFRIFENAPIVYGVGNFIFPLKNSNKAWNTGVIANLRIEKDVPISLNVHPIELKWNAKEGSLTLDSWDKDEFDELSQNLNEKITSEASIAKEYEAFVERIEKQYIHFLQPYTSKYLHKLFSLGLIPNFLDNKLKKRLYLNLIRCEAHRDVLLKVLGK